MTEAINVAIDGPSGAGKSTMARMLAQRLGYLYVDTGAMYRAIGLYAQRAGIGLGEIEKILPLLPQINISLSHEGGQQQIYLNGENVSGPIRTEESSRYASAVAALPGARAHLLDLQRQLAAGNNVIMDGRDIGTVILPRAQVKVFLTATAQERARRRFLEQQQRGEPVIYEQVLQDVEARDAQDENRQAAPLKPAQDAVLLNSTQMNMEETLERLESIIREKTHAI